jgi:peptide/nickel transport system substrate-binding protein
VLDTADRPGARPQRPGRPRRTRLILAAAPALAALLLGVAACSGDGTATDVSAASGGPVRGGTLTFAASDEPACLDPAVSPQDITGIIDRNIFDSLVSMTRGGVFHPWLAKRWTISPDGLTYTFYLRPGVRFQDGTPFTAAAVAATFAHAVNPATKSYLAAGLISAYRSATIVNPLTIEVHLSRPDSAFLQALSTPFLGIQSPRALRGSAASLCTHPVGTGPYDFASWSQGTSLTLRRNPGYTSAPASAGHSGPAYLSSLVFRFVTQDATRVGALTSGQVDVADNIPPVDLGQVSHDSSLRLARADAPGTAYTVFFNARKGPLTSLAVRQALLHAVNLSALVKSISFGAYQRAWSVLSPGTVGYDAATAGSWSYDPALADKLLSQAGWTGRNAAGYRTRHGQVLTLRWPYTPEFASSTDNLLGQGIQAYAKRVGIDISYVSEDVGSLQKDIVNGANADLYSTSYVRASPDILRFFFASDQAVARGGGNTFLLDYPRLDTWLDGAQATASGAVRARDYDAAQRYILSQALAMPTYVPVSLVGLSAKVRGMTFDPQAYPLFYDAWLER